MNKAGILLTSALAALALSGCVYRDTTDDGRSARSDENRDQRDVPVRSPGEQPVSGGPAPAPQQYPVPADNYRPWGFHDPGPNYPWTGP